MSDNNISDFCKNGLHGHCKMIECQCKCHKEKGR